MHLSVSSLQFCSHVCLMLEFLYKPIAGFPEEWRMRLGHRQWTLPVDCMQNHLSWHKMVQMITLMNSDSDKTCDSVLI